MARLDVVFPWPICFHLSVCTVGMQYSILQCCCRNLLCFGGKLWIYFAAQPMESTCEGLWLVVQCLQKLWIITVFTVLAELIFFMLVSTFLLRKNPVSYI